MPRPVSLPIRPDFQTGISFPKKFLLPLLFQPVYNKGMTTITGDQLRGHLDAMILASLESGESHGLGILQRLEEAGCGLLKLKEGSLYPALWPLRGRWPLSSLSQQCPPQAKRSSPPRLPFDAEGKRDRSLKSESSGVSSFLSSAAF
ncbi:MAG: helix-turn-helix transcriptional regulator [Pirellulales bacterium]